MNFCFLLGLFDLVKAAKNYGAKCVSNSECDRNFGLFCKLEDKLFQAHRICRCNDELSWKKGQCVNEGRVSK